MTIDDSPLDPHLLTGADCFAKLFYINPIASSLIRAEGGYCLYVNDNFLRLLGVQRDEIIGRRFDELQIWLNGDPIEQLVRSLWSGQSMYDVETRFRTSRGAIRHAMMSGEFVDVNGELCVLLLLQDTTERREAEDALRESESRFRSVIQSSADAILLADDDGLLRGWNLGAERMFGYSEADVLGQPLTMLMPERYRTPHSRGMNRFARTGQARVIGHTVELHAVRKDGSEFPMELSLATWQSGEAIYYSGIIRDTTRRTETLRALHESEAHINRLYQEVRRLFTSYVPATVAEYLMEHPQSMRLGGERQTVTVLFGDLRGFSTFSETVEPEQLIEVLNTYLSIAAEAVLQHGGTLDKYMGDAVMAVFNAPDAQPDHAWRAVQAALLIREKVALFNLVQKTPTLEFGLGINTGEAVVGNIGTAQMLNYTAIGDAVNVAKRLQENARGGEILISESTLQAAGPSVAATPGGPISLKGRSGEVNHYLLTGN